MAQAVSCWPVATQVQVQTQANPCGICGVQSGTGTGFYSGYFGFPQSVTLEQCSILIHPLLTLYNISN
jgi:hypothetical protein